MNSAAKKIFADDWIILALILFLALVLRIKGINLLLPYFEIGPDERFVLEPALRIVQTGDFTPHFYWYGAFPIYWMAAIIALALGIHCGQEVVCWRSFDIYGGDFLLFYLGRASSVVFGIGTIFLVYLIGRKVFGRATGILSAFFLSISPLHIYFSQIFKVDISLLFWVLLVVICSLREREAESTKNLVGAGVSAGLALGTKFDFLALVPFLLVVVFQEKSGQEKLKKCLGFSALAVGFFILTNPFLFLDLPGVIGAWDYFTNIKRHIYGTVEVSSSLPVGLYRLFFLFPAYFSPFIYLAFLWGLIVIYRRDWRFATFVFSYPILYFLVSSLFTRTIHPQYQFPLLPFVVLGGVSFLVELFRHPKSGVRFISGLLIVISASYSFSDLILPHLTGAFKAYRQAGEWVKREIPKDERVLFYWWVYPPTRELRFDDEYYIRTAKSVSVEKVKEVNPDWIILTDSKALRDERFKALRSYRELLRELDDGRVQGFKEVVNFRPDYLWERIAGYFYKEFSGFRIRIFRKEKGVESAG